MDEDVLYDVDSSMETVKGTGDECVNEQNLELTRLHQQVPLNLHLAGGTEHGR